VNHSKALKNPCPHYSHQELQNITTSKIHVLTPKTPNHSKNPGTEMFHFIDVLPLRT
jgi:hypothetical protein